MNLTASSSASWPESQVSRGALASSLDWAISTGLQGTSPRFPPVGVTFAGRNLSDFWEMVEKSPVINYTFTSSLSGVLGTVTPGTQTPRPTKAPAPKDPQTGCPQPLLKEGAMTAAPLTLATQKLNPCLMELCRFFQQCLCVSQRNPRTESMRRPFQSTPEPCPCSPAMIVLLLTVLMVPRVGRYSGRTTLPSSSHSRPHQPSLRTPKQLLGSWGGDFKAHKHLGLHSPPSTWVRGPHSQHHSLIRGFLLPVLYSGTLCPSQGLLHTAARSKAMGTHCS
ncbi:Hypothetical predicted protein [Marmota monax]|uniref:Uncharacterized protein n=1 Tax=Marmota monax TaxID=9995 RepID=A0A5E4AIU7_MARMO|nr:Hypothetical predicted protein [Marmota monax]